MYAAYTFITQINLMNSLFVLGFFSIQSQQTIDDEEEDEDKSGLSQSRLDQLHTLVFDAMQESGAVTSPGQYSYVILEW